MLLNVDVEITQDKWRQSNKVSSCAIFSQENVKLVVQLARISTFRVHHLIPLMFFYAFLCSTFREIIIFLIAYLININIGLVGRLPTYQTTWFVTFWTAPLLNPLVWVYFHNNWILRWNCVNSRRGISMKERTYGEFDGVNTAIYK